MTEKIAVTVVIPVRNEQANLQACLTRLGVFDEVIVVDTGSEDQTCHIASENGARVLQFHWDGHYPKKRNWVLLNHHFRNNWVLFLDADEQVTPAFCIEVQEAILDHEHEGYWLQYTNYFLRRPLRHGDAQRKLALFKIGKGLYEKIDEDAWSGLDMEVHEHPLIDGKIGEISARIDHRDDRGVAKFIDRHKDYAVWEARRTLQLRQSDHRTWSHLTDRQVKKYRSIDSWWFAPTYFCWTYFFKRGFLDGYAGLSYAFFKLWYFWTIRLLISEYQMQSIDEGSPQ